MLLLEEQLPGHLIVAPRVGHEFECALRSDHVFHFVDNFSKHVHFATELIQGRDYLLTATITVVPREQFLWSKILLLRFVLKADVVLDFDYDLIDKYTLADMLYLEDCLTHYQDSFEDTTWLTVAPLKDNGRLPEVLKMVAEHINARHKERPKRTLPSFNIETVPTGPGQATAPGVAPRKEVRISITPAVVGNVPETGTFLVLREGNLLAVAYKDEFPVNDAKYQGALAIDPGKGACDILMVCGSLKYAQSKYDIKDMYLFVDKE
jgi:hypothetical protein